MADGRTALEAQTLGIVDFAASHDLVLQYPRERGFGVFLYVAWHHRVAAPLARSERFPDPPSETPSGIWEDIFAIRRKPYVLWRNPHRSSAAYAIFPILDASARPHAIITIGGPVERFDLPQIEEQLPRMRQILEPLEREARLFSAPPFVAEG